MVDFLDEEMDIMNEQDQASKTFDSSIFQLPIERIGLKKVKSVESTESLSSVITMMRDNHIGSVLVVESEILVGIVTERDILMKVADQVEDSSKVKIQDIMTSEPLSLQSSDMIAYAMNNMHIGGYRHIPIVDENNKPVSIISIKDVMKFILDYFPEQVLNMTGEPYRGPVSRDSA
ncbi:MAG: CBS domain-containing protein [Bdellovibrionales bacterium]|jgi:CBS domain-containing protein|nr:CBS domain-containing protein [Bdellovibrionales bacterium]